jgi:hypothetical protein
MSTRTFTVAPGRALTLPKALMAGPGATHARFTGGQSFELPAERVDRFVRGRLRAGDLIEGAVDAAPDPAPAPRTKAAASLDLAAGVGARKKEG